MFLLKKGTKFMSKMKSRMGWCPLPDTCMAACNVTSWFKPGKNTDGGSGTDMDSVIGVLSLLWETSS